MCVASSAAERQPATASGRCPSLSAVASAPTSDRTLSGNQLAMHQNVFLQGFGFHGCSSFAWYKKPVAKFVLFFLLLVFSWHKKPVEKFVPSFLLLVFVLAQKPVEKFVPLCVLLVSFLARNPCRQVCVMFKRETAVLRPTNRKLNPPLPDSGWGEFQLAICWGQFTQSMLLVCCFCY